jgi:hypothetical protein
MILKSFNDCVSTTDVTGDALYEKKITDSKKVESHDLFEGTILECE